MEAAKHGGGAEGQPARVFLTTRWTLLREAADSGAAGCERALEELCRNYWYPLYAYVRRSGHGAEEARDLTQGFFQRFLSREAFKRADPELGRFRSFLLRSMKNYLLNEHRDRTSQKRGGGLEHVPLEWVEAEGRYGQEPVEGLPPDQLFDRNWARLLIREVTERLREEYEAAGQGERFNALRFSLEQPRGIPYAEVAEALGITTGGVKAAVHRLRQRFRVLFRQAVADSVRSPMEVDEEIRTLIAALR